MPKDAVLHKEVPFRVKNESLKLSQKTDILPQNILNAHQLQA